MIFSVVYPHGERANGYGYPDQILVVREVPAGPECCYLDEIEVDFTNVRDPAAVLPVLRVVGGPRRPSIHVRLSCTEAELDAWMDARDREGWQTGHSSADPFLVWCVADRDGMDPADLVRAGGVLVQSGAVTG